MPEILNLQVGQCGNQIGSAFWNVIAEEHGIQPDGFYEGTDDKQLDKIDVYFSETALKRFAPRTVIVDLDSATIDPIRSSTFGGIFRPENFIFGHNGTNSNWAKGYYTEGEEIIGYVQEALRREAENCDCLQGFQLIHSLGGGTGSGLGTLLLSKIRDEYPDRIVSTYSVVPSCKVQDTTVSPYNVLLSFQQLIHQSDSTLCIDNQALYNICHKILKLPYVRFLDLNHLVSQAMSGVTACLRFPGQLNADLRKLAVNMVPYPRLHFMLTSLAPLTSKQAKFYNRMTISNVVEQMFSSRNVLAGCDPRHGRYLTASATIRGQTSARIIENEMLNIQKDNFSNFFDWIPNNVKTVECEIPLKCVELSSSFLGNNTVIYEVFKRVSLQFSLMFKRKAFLQWFTSEGIEENEFTDAYAEVSDLISEYQQYETMEPQRKNHDDGCADNYVEH